MPTLMTPEELHKQYPLSQKSAERIAKTRDAFIQILNRRDDRLVVITGPCSLHHSDSALRYAKNLQTQIKKYENTLCIIMRAYVEKARTSVGWKGLINDPDLNNTFKIEKGLQIARELLIKINEIGVPTATEILNPLITPYFSDVTSWSVIGARTTESQIHREIASGLPMPVGFKNNTNGDIQVAIDAIQTAFQPHHHLGLDLSGKMAILKSTGNPYAHVVLRGSSTKSNYDVETIQQTIAALNTLNLMDRVLVDCSHGNSQKDHKQQLSVIKELSRRIQEGNTDFFGVMLESHLTSGKQPWNPHQPMNSEQSITDACMGWEDTEVALEQLSQAVQKRRAIG